MWRRLLGLALVVHVVFAAQRLAFKSLPRRIAEVESWRELGPVGFHLQGTQHEEIVRFVQENTGPDAVVLYVGQARGLMEHVAALLAPRLLYDARAVGPAVDTVHDRPIGRATHPEHGTGRVVLVSRDRYALALEMR